MKKVTTADARGRFADIVAAATYAKERTVVTKHGKDVVAVVPIEDLEMLERLEDHALLKEAIAAIDSSEQPLSWEEVKRELEI